MLLELRVREVIWFLYFIVKVSIDLFLDRFYNLIMYSFGKKIDFFSNDRYVYEDLESV